MTYIGSIGHYLTSKTRNSGTTYTQSRWFAFKSV